MLRLGLGLGLAAVALSGSAGAAAAQTRETLIAARDYKTQNVRTDAKAKVTQTAQPLMVPPLPERKTAKAAPIEPPLPDVWTAAEIDAAKARCTQALKGLDAVITPEPPIKQGACGTPAPIRLSRLAKVTFTPAALINCGMLAPLQTWITKDLQPLAARQLGAKITTIEVMSDYSCRTAFGRVGNKLSQHAYVDALDIRGFVTDKGQKVHVLDGWGATNRDIAAAVAAAKAGEEKLAQAQAEAAKPQQDNPRNAKSGASGKPATPGAGLVKATRVDSVDVVTAILPGPSKKPPLAARLGGPAAEAAPADARKQERKATDKGREKTAALSPGALATPPAGPHARFLRQAHAAACRIFGTTLGPEANEAHRNHFHVDMAERKIKKICD
ncbi:extensin family protein [Hyphomicrobium sp.]|uniref:extensin-like domain-containing protein n=1 Tax=Hyphomicrobium sp. TaxID=82 RepID=UPI0025C697AF|nr:extensin family protein [Hyphomicrobium sp.]